MKLEIASAPALAGSTDIPRLERGGAELIDRYCEEWLALCGRSACDEPFYRPEWIRAYLRAFAANAVLVLFTMRRAGRLVALLPLIKETDSLAGMPARKLRSAGNTHTCRFDMVHEPETAAAVIPHLWAALVAEPGWDVLELNDTQEGGVLTQLAGYARGCGHAVQFAPGLAPPYLDLTAFSGYDALLQRLDAKFRANLRRRARKLDARAAVLCRGRAAEPMVGRFFELERSGWKGEKGSAITCATPTRMFYGEIARAAEAGGYLSMYALEVSGRPAAMFFGLEYRGRYYLIKTAYDEALRDVSPGQLLTQQVLRECFERGGIEFDFLGGDMDWKQDWAPQTRRLTDIFIFRGAAGRALHALRFRLRPAVASAVRWLRPRAA
ncbi:MAG TPA: GNAT family N-acetyltransferase [Burkholderiales bacterium]|nr:GNAT family N-acetyltransferase [Burkholderiales bacterium]